MTRQRQRLKDTETIISPSSNPNIDKKNTTSCARVFNWYIVVLLLNEERIEVGDSFVEVVVRGVQRP